MPGLAVAVATTAAVAAMAPSAWATFPGLPFPDSVPQLSKTVRVTPRSGIVFVRVRGAGAATRLLGSREVPVGSTINTRRGQALVEAATADQRSTNSVIVSKGRAKLSQARRGARAIVLRLPRLHCPSKRDHRLRTRTPRRTNRVPSARSGRLKPKKKVGTRTPGRTNRVLSARSCRLKHKKSKYKVKGRYSTGASCGTDWTTINKCGATDTIVRDGRVHVVNRKKRRTRIARPGHPVRVRVGGSFSLGGSTAFRWRADCGHAPVPLTTAARV